jgi:hypothetical protein
MRAHLIICTCFLQMVHRLTTAGPDPGNWRTTPPRSRRLFSRFLVPALGRLREVTGEQANNPAEYNPRIEARSSRALTLVSPLPFPRVPCKARWPFPSPFDVGVCLPLLINRHGPRSQAGPGAHAARWGRVCDLVAGSRALAEAGDPRVYAGLATCASRSPGRKILFDRSSSISETAGTL